MIKLTPVKGAEARDIPASQAAQRLHRDALARVRAAALAWRNGLAGLLAGLLGFSLIKGRSDVSELAPPWSAIAGLALLAALVFGGYGAMRLLWAAHGRPELLDRRALRSALASDAEEAAHGVRALRIGIRMSLLCAGLLIVAVAVTWYGPARQQPQVEVTSPAGTICGSVIRADQGLIILATSSGPRSAGLASVTAITAVSSCGSPQDPP
jgi:amino acid transporter